MLKSLHNGKPFVKFTIGFCISNVLIHCTKTRLRVLLNGTRHIYLYLTVRVPSDSGLFLPSSSLPYCCYNWYPWYVHYPLSSWDTWQPASCPRSWKLARRSLILCDKKQQNKSSALHFKQILHAICDIEILYAKIFDHLLTLWYLPTKKMWKCILNHNLN